MGCQCCLTTIGWLAIASLLWKFTNAIYRIVYPFVLAKPVNLRELAGASWAVVTGSTDGIGKAYAFELARRGFKIVLISRNSAKLEEVKAEIVKECNVEVKTMMFDFTNPNVDEYEKTLISHLSELDVGVLINNVGVSIEYPEVMHKIEGGLKRLSDMCIANTIPVTVLTAGIIPQMIERGKGIVVNVASAAALKPLYMWSVYSATKKYVSWLTNILRRDYANSGVVFQTLRPMLVATKMAKVKHTSLFVPSADVFVRSAINTIGITPDTTGFLTHQIQAEALRQFPSGIVDIFLNKAIVQMHAKAVAKKLREAKAQ